MKVSNYTGQILLGLGVAILAALFLALRHLVQHWRAWHVTLILLACAAFIIAWRRLSR